MLRYIEGPEIKLTVRDRIFLDAEFYSGEKMEGLEPHRLFPITGLTRYIALIDPEGEIVGIISNADNLLAESRDAVVSALEEYYMIPKITKILKWESKYHEHLWTAETTHGRVVIAITDSTNHVKRLFDDRVLIKDGADNRYEIPDLNLLDAASVRMILPDI